MPTGQPKEPRDSCRGADPEGLSNRRGFWYLLKADCSLPGGGRGAGEAVTAAVAAQEAELPPEPGLTYVFVRGPWGGSGTPRQGPAAASAVRAARNGFLDIPLAFWR